MTNNSNVQLEGMLDDLESDLAERRESFAGDNHARIREAVGALANDLPDYRRAHVVFIGARDDGSPSGLPITDELLQNRQPGIADYRNPNLAEPPHVLGFVQRCGVAIATARRELSVNGNPLPEFSVQPTHTASP